MTTTTTKPALRHCNGCGVIFDPLNPRDLFEGRGRHLGEHPDQMYHRHTHNGCSGNIAWNGSVPVRYCVDCHAELPWKTPQHVQECDACYTHREGTCRENV